MNVKISTGIKHFKGKTMEGHNINHLCQWYSVDSRKWLWFLNIWQLGYQTEQYMWIISKINKTEPMVLSNGAGIPKCNNQTH